ncbi:5'-methylthioadenosine/adenosylhomocysteine nucleosidase [Paenibacillus sp. y28]|uniref:5'-methylthioadenosine/adenosylhomocysteine nucleosidase n=1 Tax=Paenibacillus sp. y28 TaxID=3129110 RepID=UPI003016EB3E
MKWNTIGLIGAMQEEIELMQQVLEQQESVQKAGISFIKGQYAGKNVILCRCGVGKVNAAVCTQLLVDHFQVDVVLFTGVAGALDPSLDIGDIVISTDCIQHDMDASVLGFPRGTIPFAEVSVFEAEPELVKLAADCSRKVFEGRTLEGRILSGDQFIASRETVKQLYEELGGACTEMEGAAVAQVCVMNKVPFVIIRSMSDKADGSAHVNFAEFTVRASANSHQIIEQILQNIE